LVMKTIMKKWEENYSELGQVDFNCPQENKIIKQTMRPWEYEGRANEIVNRFEIRDSILEVGCGYGGLAQEILKRISISYTVVDNKAMLTQARRLLGDKVEYIEAKEIKKLQSRKFELFISHFCLSETPAEYREYILKYIIKNCQKISIVDFRDEIKPTLLIIQSGWDITPLKIEGWIEKYFIVKKRKLRKKRGDQFVYIGERKKEA